MAGIACNKPPKLAACDVFLSFRGLDTRKTFTSCLYHDLVGAGLRVFRDDDELSKGKEIGSELLQAIANSRICMPILSPNFATSAWCLREVAHMVDCRQKSGDRLEIMPIFYHVEVTDVKLRTGSAYEVHINEHGDRFGEEDLLKWKNALKEVAKIKGWNVNENSDDGELIKSIVHDILIKLGNKHRNLPQEIVERHDEVDAITKLMDVDSKGTRFIVIHGMGGIGKTTLAKVIFNKFYFHYEGSSFLESVREGAERQGLLCLQQKLLSDILKRDFKMVFSDFNDGINNIRGRLCSKKLLIVIDDVDDDNQLKILAGESAWFGSGSRIIVTTRDLQVLPMQGEAHNYYFHELKQMKLNDALCLFSRHAFGKDAPPDKDYDVLSEKIVTALGCLPLALEVIGSYLFRLCLNSSDSNKIWEETLNELSVPHKKVDDMLMISINKLNFHQRQIFLDIASFFIYQDKTNAMCMWDGCGFYPFKNINILIQMSLIKITRYDVLWMHDVLRDLGRQLILKEGKRVWKEQQAKKIIEQQRGIISIEGLSQNLDERSLIDGALAKSEDIRFLKLEWTWFGPRSKGYWKKFFSNLRWLCWCLLPSDFHWRNFCPSNLVVLQLIRSNISEDWNGWERLKMANKLKVLDLTGCTQLKRTPDFSSFILLERLILTSCDGLVEIDPSIGKLGKLTFLNMWGCGSLRGLPEEIGSLTSLTTVSMGGRGQEFQLPYSMGNLASLTSLEITFVHIVELPESIGDLTSLVELDISYSRCNKLPNTIGNLKSLKVINMEGTDIKGLPASFGQLTCLEKIRTSRCLHVNGEIAKSISNLSHLKELHLHTTLSEDSELKSLTEFPSSLDTLVITTEWMEVAPDLSYLSNLTRLNLKIRAIQRADLRWISKLSKLKKLDINNSCITMPASLICDDMKLLPSRFMEKWDKNGSVLIG